MKLTQTLVGSGHNSHHLGLIPWTSQDASSLPLCARCNIQVCVSHQEYTTSDATSSQTHEGLQLACLTHLASLNDLQPHSSNPYVLRQQRLRSTSIP